jgi:hypothetical protein
MTGPVSPGGKASTNAQSRPDSPDSDVTPTDVSAQVSTTALRPREGTAGTSGVAPRQSLSSLSTRRRAESQAGEDGSQITLRRSKRLKAGISESTGIDTAEGSRQQAASDSEDASDIAPVPHSEALPTIFPMAGCKVNLLEHDMLRLPLVEALTSGEVHRLVDAFAGTASIPLWLSTQGLLPKETVLNELTPYRHIVLDQVYCMGNGKAVCDEVARLGKALHQLNYKTSMGLPMDAPDVDEDTLATWTESARFDINQAKACGRDARRFLLREAALQWPIGSDSPNNNPTSAAIYLLLQHNTFKRGTPVDLRPASKRSAKVSEMGRETGMVHPCFSYQMLGTAGQVKKGQGKVKIDAFVSKISSEIERGTALLQNATMLRTNGWDRSAQSVSGELTIVDPPYLLKPGQRPNDAMTYLPGFLPEYSSKGAYGKVLSFSGAWQSGARFILTNRFHDGLRSLLTGMGWHLSDRFRNGDMSEFVATNFDPIKGAPIRQIGLGQPETPLQASVPEDDEPTDPSRMRLFEPIYRPRTFGPVGGGQSVDMEDAIDEPAPVIEQDADMLAGSSESPAVAIPPLVLPGATGELSVSQRFITALQDRGSGTSQAVKSLPVSMDDFLQALILSGDQLDWRPVDIDRHIWSVTLPFWENEFLLALDPSLQEIEDIRYPTVDANAAMVRLSMGADARALSASQATAGSSSSARLPGRAPMALSPGYLDALTRQYPSTRAFRQDFACQKGEEVDRAHALLDCIRNAATQGATMKEVNEGWNIWTVDIPQPNVLGQPFRVGVAFEDRALGTVSNIKRIWSNEAEPALIELMENAARIAARRR